MLRRVVIVLLLGWSCAPAQTTAPGRAIASGEQRIALHSGWQLQSSCKVQEKGETISTSGYAPSGWYPATVPGGVLANLVADKIYPDPNYGMNLRQIPGTTYRVGTIFTNQPMADDSPFKCSWWYRTEFTLPAAWHGRKLWLHFDGINYRANIWINGKQIARATTGDSGAGLDDLARGEVVAGAWRWYEFNVGEFVEPGKANVLAVEVFPQTEFDLGINWVDWNPAPPDKNMGLWRGVYLSSSGPVAVRHPQVVTALSVWPGSSSREPGSETRATLTVSAEVRNASNSPQEGVLRARIEPLGPHEAKENIEIEQRVRLGAGDTREVSFHPADFPRLQVDHPRLWWPADLGAQNLYEARVEFVEAGRVSDVQSTHFGIRVFTSELTPEGHRLFKINGHPILIRGAGWAPDFLLNASDKRVEDQLRYVRHMHLNTIRLEGKIETEHFFDLADRMGILVMPGWCCCSQWEEWQRWTPADHVIARESLRSQATRLRNHPSVFVWLNGSDNPPPPDVEREYLDVLNDVHWPNPVVSSATARATTVTGPSGVKMAGPYDWVPPNYWLEDKGLLGGAFGYATEIGPGPAIPPVESLKKFLPAEHLWPQDEWWNFHAGGGSFKQVNIFNRALEERYGEATSLDDYERKAQLMAYDGERAMFEAYGRNKYVSTGVIQWMLNNAWPSIIWHLYDWYLMPAGGYFGTRVANEPLHVQYSYDDGTVYVVNSYYRAFERMKVSAEVFDFGMRPAFSRQVQLDIPEDSSTMALVLPEAEENFSDVYFLRLRLLDAEGREVSRNFYALSTRPDTLDWEHSNYFMTPVSEYADFTRLGTLPDANLSISAASETRAGEEVTRITVQNPSQHLAFMVHLRVTNTADEDVLPVFWDDNYFSLLPGERREITARYDAAQLHGPAEVRVDGWNIVPRAVHSATK